MRSPLLFRHTGGRHRLTMHFRGNVGRMTGKVSVDLEAGRVRFYAAKCLPTRGETAQRGIARPNGTGIPTATAR